MYKFLNVYPKEKRSKGENIMSKKYYPIEDAINNISQKFKLGLKDANKMNEEELSNVEKYITKIVFRKPNGELVKHWKDWTATTGRHIKAFCGMSKKEYSAL